MLNIAISDRHPLFAHGLKHLLETETGFNVVGIGKNESELADIISRNNVNIAIVDLQMSLVNGMVACKKLRLSHPDLKIIMVSVFGNIDIHGQAAPRQTEPYNTYVNRSMKLKLFIPELT